MSMTDAQLEELFAMAPDALIPATKGRITELKKMTIFQQYMAKCGIKDETYCALMFLLLFKDRMSKLKSSPDDGKWQFVGARVRPPASAKSSGDAVDRAARGARVVAAAPRGGDAVAGGVGVVGGRGGDLEEFARAARAAASILRSLEGSSVVVARLETFSFRRSGPSTSTSRRWGCPRSPPPSSSTIRSSS